MGRVPTLTMGARIILLWNPSLPSEVAMMLLSSKPDDEKTLLSTLQSQSLA